MSLESLWTLLPKCWPKHGRKTIVRLQVTIDSVRELLDSLDRGEAGNTARVLVLESLVIQILTLWSRWELLTIIAASCTSICPIRGLPRASHGSRGVGRPRYEISLPQMEVGRPLDFHEKLLAILGQGKIDVHDAAIIASNSHLLRGMSRNARSNESYPVTILTKITKMKVVQRELQILQKLRKLRILRKLQKFVRRITK